MNSPWHRRACVVGVYALLVTGGCLAPGAEQCANGLTCPAGSVCLADGTCGGQGAVDACRDVDDATACEFVGVANGVCRAGLCVAAGCGNSVIELAEACDDGNALDGDGCSRDCISDESCGNGVRDAVEQCDCGSDADQLPAGCTRVNDAGAGADCRPDCSRPGCGDGLREAAEDCEVSDLGGLACSDLGFYAGDLACQPSCRYDLSACTGTCGDGEVSGPEECDGVAAQACADFGFVLGRMGCFGCGLDIRACPALVGVAQFEEGSQDAFAGVSVIDDGVAFAIHTSGRIGRIDADGTVTDLPSPNVVGSIQAYAVSALSPTEVFAAGIPGMLEHYDGAAWSVVRTAPAEQFVSVFAATPTDVFVAGSIYDFVEQNYDGQLAHWDGAAWTLLKTVEYDLLGVAGCSATDVVGFGRYGMLVHFDGTTTTEISVGGNDLNAGACVDGAVIVVGAYGRAMRIDHGVVTMLTTNLSTSFGSASAIPGRGLFVGNALTSSVGVVEFASDIWSQLRTTFPVTPNNLVLGAWQLPSGVFRFLDQSRVIDVENLVVDPAGPMYAASADVVPGAVWRLYSNNVYRNQRVVYTFLAGGLYQVFAVDADLAFVTNTDGDVMRCTPIGCSSTGASALGFFQRVDFLSPTEAFAVSVTGAIAHWDGVAWTVMAAPNLGILRAVDARTVSDVWAVGDNGAMLHYDGVTWVSVASGTSANLYAVLALAADRVIAGGARTLIEWDGASWQPTGVAVAGAIYDLDGDDDLTLAIGQGPPQQFQRDVAGWFSADFSTVLGDIRQAIVGPDAIWLASYGDMIKFERGSY